jgi:hypothetical protein
MPDKMKAIAELAFIVTQPGKTLLRIGISTIHPTSTRHPTRMTIELAAFGTAVNVEIRRELGTGELFTSKIIGKSRIVRTNGTYPYFIF